MSGLEVRFSFFSGMFGMLAMNKDKRSQRVIIVWRPSKQNTIARKGSVSIPCYFIFQISFKFLSTYQLYVFKGNSVVFQYMYTMCKNQIRVTRIFPLFVLGTFKIYVILSVFIVCIYAFLNFILSCLQQGFSWFIAKYICYQSCQEGLKSYHKLHTE